MEAGGAFSSRGMRAAAAARGRVAAGEAALAEAISVVGSRCNVSRGQRRLGLVRLVVAHNGAYAAGHAHKEE